MATTSTRSPATSMHLWRLAQRMLDLLIERDGEQDVARRLGAMVDDLEQRRSPLRENGGRRWTPPRD